MTHKTKPKPKTFLTFLDEYRKAHQQNKTPLEKLDILIEYWDILMNNNHKEKKSSRKGASGHTQATHN